jgi:hypothetical protein
MPRIFVSQNTIDRWLGGGGIVLDGDVLRFNSGMALDLVINPAVYFDHIEGNEADPYDIIGAVKSSQELAQMGGEHYDRSVVLGDYAYTVNPGFVAIPVGPDNTEAALDGASWAALLSAMEALGTP